MIAKEKLPNANLINTSIESFCLTNNRKFDTIIARQIFHYVENVELVIKLLKRQLSKNGLFYVGQFVVQDDNCNIWHEKLIRQISENRKRSFTIEQFKHIFEKNGFKIADCCLEDYEENVKDFYSRRTNKILSYDVFFKSVKESLNGDVRKKLQIRSTKDNLFFTVQFCHLFLKLDECMEG